MDISNHVNIEGKLIKGEKAWIFEITHSCNGIVIFREAQEIWSDLTPQEALFAGQCIFNEHITKVKATNNEVIAEIQQQEAQIFKSDEKLITPFIELEEHIHNLCEYENTYFVPHESRLMPVAYMACCFDDSWNYGSCGPIRATKEDAEADIVAWDKYFDLVMRIKPIYNANHSKMINDVMNLTSICHNSQ